MSGLLQLFIVAVCLLDRQFLIRISASSFECDDNYKACPNGLIDYPFYWENSENEYCGYPGLSAKCSDSGRPIITLSNHSYYFQNTGDSVKLWDRDTADQICPQPRHNFSSEEALALSMIISTYYEMVTYFYHCITLPRGVSPNLPCIDSNNSNASGYSFATQNSSILKGFNWYGNCQESVTVPMYSHITNYTEGIQSGFELWSQPSTDCQLCEYWGGKCRHNRTSTFFCDCGGILYPKTCPTYSSHGIPGYVRKLIKGSSIGVGGSLLIVFFVCMIRCLVRKFKSSPTNVEVFLQSYGSHVLQRYKYSDIKKMSNSFKDTLGQGGYGSVFKGKLPDGRMVAVKLLNESKGKGNGEEFINEVTTIGRTNHVNVVTLIGFCAEGTKRALVYEFMVNGSLEKIIYKKKSLTDAYAPALGWEQLYQIALGIARGLEYLHRGCKNRILHFDIKPHNILLDSEFVPKISDFGLAKLSKTRDSVVSMVGTRGTSGYIAPELYCRNFGVVSYKSDVYSYGMMLFEMIGGRKNIDPTVENISEIYFPHWIYNHLNKEKKIEGSEDVQIQVSADILEDEIARKMVIVALWCIQAHPTNRPSMKKVAEMLEVTSDKLEMPPNPSLDPSSGISPLSP